MLYRGYTLIEEWGEGVVGVAVTKNDRLFWIETDKDIRNAWARAKLWVDIEGKYSIAYAITVPPGPP